MNITQQPAAISFSGNLVDIIVDGVTVVPMTLKCEDDIILVQNYTAGADGIVTIDLKQLVEDQLSYTINTEEPIFVQPSIAKTFTVVLNDQEVTFMAIRGGVDNLQDTVANFVRHNFLTWQPTTKQVTYSSPEYLSYYAEATARLMITGYQYNENKEIISSTNIAGELAAGKVSTCDMRYAHVASVLGFQPVFYDVWVEDLDTNRLSYIQRYVADISHSDNEQWILWENSLGGLDTLRAYGKSDIEQVNEHNLAEINEESLEYRVDTTTTYQKNTGHLNKHQRVWLRDLAPAHQKYIYHLGSLRKIVLQESNVTYSDTDTLSSYTIKYKYTSTRPYLNVVRHEPQAQEVLNFSVPDLEDFTLPPRLVEFPRLGLDEGVLLLGQSPHDEKFGVTSVGRLIDLMKDVLPLGGGTTEYAGNLRINADGYICKREEVDGEIVLSPLNSAYSDTAGVAEVAKATEDFVAGSPAQQLVESKLSNLNDDDARGVITFLQGLVSQEVSRFMNGITFEGSQDSLIDGAGIIIDHKRGRIQADTIEARRGITTQSMAINQATAMSRDYYFSEAATILSVDTLEGEYILELEEQEGRVCPFVVDDIIFGTINNLADGGLDFYESWMYIKAVDGWQLTVQLYSDKDIDGPCNYPPRAAMTIMQRGNRYVEDRQSCWYMSSREGIQVYLAGVNEPKLTKANYAMFMGLPKSTAFMTEVMGFQGLPVNANQPYIFSKGMIVEDIIRVDYEGMVGVTENYRGVWSSEDASSDTRYYRRKETYVDVVYHEGNKWQYNSDERNALPPAADNAAWLLVMPKGEKGDQGDAGENGQPGAPGAPGNDGTDGKDGSALIDGGTWASGIDYIYNDQFRMFVVYNDIYYMRGQRGVVIDNTLSPAQAVQAGSGEWQLFDMPDYIKAQLVLSKVLRTDPNSDGYYTQIEGGLASYHGDGQNRIDIGVDPMTGMIGLFYYDNEGNLAWDISANGYNQSGTAYITWTDLELIPGEQYKTFADAHAIQHTLYTENYLYIAHGTALTNLQQKWNNHYLQNKTLIPAVNVADGWYDIRSSLVLIAQGEDIIAPSPDGPTVVGRTNDHYTYTKIHIEGGVKTEEVSLDIWCDGEGDVIFSPPDGYTFYNP